MNKKHSLFALFVSGLTAGSCIVHAAELKVVTEYIYPTSYTITPIIGPMMVGPGGMIMPSTPATAIVEPGGFQMREVGVLLQAEAYVTDLSVADKVAAANSARSKNGNSDLMVFAATGDEATVRKLLQRSSGSVHTANQFGSTALMGACAGGYTNIVDLLLGRGASVNAKSKKGFTSLMFAARNGHTDVVRRLLSSGAMVDATDARGQTALMYAVDAGHADTISALAAAGANVNVRTRGGASPLQLAKNAKNQDLVVLLTRCGARN
jgi:ankyrin repeat protein